MSVEEDIRMWLGGLPYDYATVGEVCEHVLENQSFITEYMEKMTGLGTIYTVFDAGRRYIRSRFFTPELSLATLRNVT
jgi:hypothetical protein